MSAAGAGGGAGTSDADGGTRHELTAGADAQRLDLFVASALDLSRTQAAMTVSTPTRCFPSLSAIASASSRSRRPVSSQSCRALAISSPLDFATSPFGR